MKEENKTGEDISPLKTEEKVSDGSVCDGEGEPEKTKTDYEELLKQYQAQIATLRLSACIDRAIYESRAKNPDIVRKSINRDRIKINENGEAEGLAEQIENLKKNDSYLFEKPVSATAFSVGIGVRSASETNGVLDAFLKRNPALKNKF